MMGKKNRRKQQKNVEHARKEDQKNSVRPSIWKRVLSLIFIVSAVASIISLCLSFLPQVSVRPEGKLDPRNPFSTPFVITNSGIIGIHDVTFLCRLRHATNEQGGKIIVTGGVRPTGFVISEIGPGESATTGLPFTWIGDVTASADFDFVLEYRPSYFPFKKNVALRFATARQKDGSLVWLPRALSEP
jgi:hypothetical protein